MWRFKNHKSANDLPNDMLLYLKKEFENNAIIGLFKNNLFNSGLKISPLNSVTKKDTSERRVILDSNYHRGHSVNNFISKDEYMGKKIELVYPSG